MRLTLAALGASLVLAGCAAGPKADDHAAHHPPRGAAGAAPTTREMDTMMKSMQEMHDRMMAAQGPDERARLMQEHRKLMHEGMGMMGRMRGGPGGGMSMGPEMMGRRMDMMEMMMQMMMDRDRDAAKPPAPR